MNKTYNITEAAEILGVSVKTLQRWDREGKLVAGRTPSNRRYYTEAQINEVMRGETMELFYVIENRNIGVADKPEFMETVLFTGTKEECAEYETMKRREYKDRTRVDCFVQSESERKRIKEINEFWNSLTKEEKKEIIIVDGKKYNKALYNFQNGRR